MTPLDTLLLGIIQGLTEFLPISSTTHLTLAGKFLGLVGPENASSWTAYIAVLQLGTLVSVVLYFSTDIRDIFVALVRDVREYGVAGYAGYSPPSRLGVAVAVGTVPVVIAGLLLKDIIHGTLTKSTLVIIVSLVVLALLLWVAERMARHTRRLADLKLSDAVIIGCAQALALIPGSSRSGTTLTAGLFLGLARPDAARFSFLLSIPAVLASGLYELSRIDPRVFEFGMTNLMIGTVCSALSGYAAIAWLIRYLSRSSTMVFVWYRIGLGLLLGVLLFAGLIES